jgi:hypothetical protein
VPSERDRQKVVVQITQNLSSRIKNKHAFELPCLYIPDQSDKPSRVRRAAHPYSGGECPVFFGALCGCMFPEPCAMRGCEMATGLVGTKKEGMGDARGAVLFLRRNTMFIPSLAQP